jgi:hypothetical protein
LNGGSDHRTAPDDVPFRGHRTRRVLQTH